jgi:hypothetical protein
MGGHFWADPDGHVQNAAAGTEFDLVISLITRTGHGPDPGVHHLISEIPDSPLTAEQLHSVQQLAVTAAQAVPTTHTDIPYEWSRTESGLPATDPRS